MAESDLTRGFCAKANTIDNAEEYTGPTPVIQILSMKKISGGTSAAVPMDRYRIIISDGAHFMQAMLSTSVNELVEDGTIRRNVVAKLAKWETQNLKGTRILIIFTMDPISYPDEKLGTPVNVSKPAGGNEAPMAVDKDVSASRAPVAAPVASRAAAPAAPSSSRVAEKVGPIFPVEGLNPYHNKWTIKVRVTSKSEKKKWSNAKGEGQLFSVNLMDETSEIKATGFNSAVDQFYDMLEEGKVYYITKGKVVLARKNFSHLPNDYELTIDGKTEITLCPDATGVPEVKFAFVALEALEEIAKDSIVDVIGLVHNVTDVSEIVTKQGKSLSKRELALVDRSGYTCSLTLWGKQAESWSHHDNPVIACKGLKLSDFNGKSLSASSSSTLQVNPDTPEAHNLRGWYEGEGKNSSFKNFSSGERGGGGMGSSTLDRNQMMTLQAVRESDLGTHDKPDPFTARATIINIKHDNLMYPACKSEKCNKKVVDTGNGYHCEKCEQTWDKPEYRYLLGMQVSDHTTQAWLQAFNDVGTEIMGMPADELNLIKEENETEYQKSVAKAHGKVYNFACRAKQDTYQEQTRVRYGINRAFPLDFAAECRAMQKMMAKYQNLIPVRY